MANLEPSSAASNRRPAMDPDAVPRPITGLSWDYASGYEIPRHRHAKSQVVYARAGVMTVSTAEGTWVVPPQRAVWVPARTEHEIRMSGNVEMRTLYLDALAARELPIHCCVLNVGTLLRELILSGVDLPQLYALGGPEERLVLVLLDEIRAMQVAPLHLPQPRDPRLLKIATALGRDPADGRDLEQWSRAVAASPRTLARLFRRETGLTFGRWRQQLRLLRALEWLAGGRSVTDIALSLGYDSTSAFVAMFRRNLGHTPGRYFSDQAGQ
jgi:AraC-like DNA-binding protein/mannose-6-phosphate isomerase-like protein (cupin superfamily)